MFLLDCHSPHSSNIRCCSPSIVSCNCFLDLFSSLSKTLHALQSGLSMLRFGCFYLLAPCLHSLWQLSSSFRYGSCQYRTCQGFVFSFSFDLSSTFLLQVRSQYSKRILHLLGCCAPSPLTDQVRGLSSFKKHAANFLYYFHTLYSRSHCFHHNYPLLRTVFSLHNSTSTT